MTAEKRAEPTPGTGRFECDNAGLVVERFATGGCSFDIFDASTWPGSEEHGMAYARLIADTAAERDRLKLVNAALLFALEFMVTQVEDTWAPDCMPLVEARAAITLATQEAGDAKQERGA